MKKNNLLIATHGDFAPGILDAASLIFGEIKDITAMSLKAGMQVDDFRNQIAEYIQQHDEENILILVDLLSGSPFNSVIPFLQKENIYVVTGLNLPMLLEVGMSKDFMEFDELCKLAKNIGTDGIVSKDEILNRGRK